MLGGGVGVGSGMLRGGRFSSGMLGHVHVSVRACWMVGWLRLVWGLDRRREEAAGRESRYEALSQVKGSQQAAAGQALTSSSDESDVLSSRISSSYASVPPPSLLSTCRAASSPGEARHRRANP